MQSLQSIWILEDDVGAQFVYEEILGIRYSLKMMDSLAGLQRTIDAQEPAPLLLIVDLRLTDGSFTTFISTEEGRAFIDQVPFIVVSSLDDLDALRFCFNQGAADYITKPFGKCELVVKVQRILEKGALAGADQQPFHLDIRTMTVENSGKRSAVLTAKEFQIMVLFQEGKGVSVDRDYIITTLWNGMRVTNKALDVHLFNLRTKLNQIGLEVRFQAPNSYVVKKADERLIASEPVMLGKNLA